MERNPEQDAKFIERTEKEAAELVARGKADALALKTTRYSDYFGPPPPEPDPEPLPRKRRSRSTGHFLLKFAVGVLLSLVGWTQLSVETKAMIATPIFWLAEIGQSDPSPPGTPRVRHLTPTHNKLAHQKTDDYRGLRLELPAYKNK